MAGLLYDQIVERAVGLKRRRGTVAFGSRNRLLLSILRRCVVYDLTDVVGLQEDWERGQDQPIPKKPPHDSVWCEWSHQVEDGPEAGGSLFKFRVGCVISIVSLDFLKKTVDLVDPDHADTATASEWNLWLQTCDYAYTTTNFVRFDAQVSGPKTAAYAAQVSPGTTFADVDRCFFLARDECRFIRSFKMEVIPASFFRKASQQSHGLPLECSIFELPCHKAAYGGDNDPIFRPWPAFLAFGLLHCKNIVTEDRPPTLADNRHTEKHDLPPRATCKTLKIEVPGTCHKRETLDEPEDDGPKVRFHLCSGHFKNLQHERYKSKGWHWWPAHWRGARSLGRVDKRYELHGATEAH